MTTYTDQSAPTDNVYQRVANLMNEKGLQHSMRVAYMRSGKNEMLTSYMHQLCRTLVPLKTAPTFNPGQSEDAKVVMVHPDSWTEALERKVVEPGQVLFGGAIVHLDDGIRIHSGFTEKVMRRAPATMIALEMSQTEVRRRIDAALKLDKK